VAIKNNKKKHMKWYLAKIVFRIICGNGSHTAQFDEQLRLVGATNAEQAFNKAQQMGQNEQESFYNQHQQIVQWKFINVAELHLLAEMTDGAELYSSIKESEDADLYCDSVHRKAKHIKERFTEIIEQF